MAYKKCSLEMHWLLASCIILLNQALIYILQLATFVGLLLLVWILIIKAFVLKWQYQTGLYNVRLRHDKTFRYVINLTELL